MLAFWRLSLYFGYIQDLKAWLHFCGQDLDCIGKRFPMCAAGCSVSKQVSKT